MEKNRINQNVISYCFRIGKLSGITKTSYFTVQPLKNEDESAAKIEEWMKKIRSLTKSRY
ncbi:hypothetical protein EWI07_01765 [Sporolactobacillus sp. THM7-4]|nr:hypothetical protein EWI07_01765 [Sporolactobacillus sp. THM7-4]